MKLSKKHESLKGEEHLKNETSTTNTDVRKGLLAKNCAIPKCEGPKSLDQNID